MKIRLLVTILFLSALASATVRDVTQAPYSAVGNGSTNNITAFNSACTDSVAGDTILIGTAGIYNINSQFTCNKAITIDGVDKTTTSIRAGAAMTNVVSMSGTGLGSTTAITANTADQATTVTVAAGGLTTMGGIVAGDYIVTSEGGIDNSTGSTDPTTCDVSGCRGDVAVVTAVNGNVMTTGRPLTHPMNSVNAPTVRKLTPLSGVTIKNLKVDGNNLATNGINMSYLVNSTFIDITSTNYTSGGSALIGTYYYNNTYTRFTVSLCGSSTQGCIDLRQGNQTKWTTLSVTTRTGGANFGLAVYRISDSTFQDVTVDQNLATGRAFKTLANAHDEWTDITVKNGATNSTFAIEYYSHHNVFRNCVNTTSGGHAFASFGNYNSDNWLINCTLTAVAGSNAFSQSASGDTTWNDHNWRIIGGTFTAAGTQAALQMNETGLFMDGVTIIRSGAQAGAGLAYANGGNPINGSCIQNSSFSNFSAGGDISFTAGGGTGNIFTGNTTPDGTTPGSLPAGAACAQPALPPSPFPAAPTIKTASYRLIIGSNTVATDGKLSWSCEKDGVPVVATRANTFLVGATNRTLRVFLDDQLRKCQDDNNGTLTEIGGGVNPVVMRVGGTANYTNSTTTFSNITGLSMSLNANTDYNFTCVLMVSAAATTTGVQIGVSGPSVTNWFRWEVEHYTAATTKASYGGIANDAVATGALPTASAGTQVTPVLIHGGISVATTVGDLNIDAASEVATSAITIYRGSHCEVF